MLKGILRKFGYVHVSTLPIRECTIGYPVPMYWHNATTMEYPIIATLRNGALVHGTLIPYNIPEIIVKEDGIET